MGGRGGGAAGGSHDGAVGLCSIGTSRISHGKHQGQVCDAVTGGTTTIPSGVKKMVQSLKEVLRYVPESEIYAVLKDSNMDPNETVNRLLSQDTFHEVKSKREKKKEYKDASDIKSRSTNMTGNRTGRGGIERNARPTSSQFPSTESGLLQMKSGSRKENVPNSFCGSSFSADTMHSVGRQFPVSSDHGSREKHSDFAYSTSQSLWSVVPGQVSMADIVKMGRPASKAPSVPPPYGYSSKKFSESKVSGSSWEAGNSPNHDFNADDEWPSIEPTSAICLPNVHEENFFEDSSSLSLNGEHLSMNCSKGNGQATEHGNTETVDESRYRPISVGSRRVQGDKVENDAHHHLNYSNSNSDTLERDDGENGAISVAANFQQLELKNDEREVPEEENPSVIIPNHLQIHGEDFAHLSFGSFGSAVAPKFSGCCPSKPCNLKLDENSEGKEGPSDSRNIKDADDNPIDSINEDIMQTSDCSAVRYDSSALQQEDKSEVSPESQYVYSSSSAGYPHGNTNQSPTSFSNSQFSSQSPIYSNSQFRSQSPNAFTSSLPGNLLHSSAHSGRETDLSYSPFPATKYSNSINSITMAEALRGGPASAAPPSHQQSHTLLQQQQQQQQQQLAVHPFSQPTLPLGHLIGYPFMPQSYTYMPSAFQQTFPGSSAYHQALAAMLPHYKTTVSMNNLPQSAAVASGYAFSNPSSYPTPTYDDLLKESTQFLSLRQSENPAMWVQSQNARTMAGAPGDSGFYNMQGQSQAHANGFRQAQQPSAYPNYYPASEQSGRDGQPPRQSQQLWQSSY